MGSDSGRGRRRIACTVVAKNYLAFARVLARSFLSQEPDARVVVLLLDRVEGVFDPEAEPFETVQVEQLDNVPEPRRLFFQYSVLELATAIKPYFLEWLIAREGDCDVVFLDPDILVLQPFDSLWSVLDSHPVALTPHLLAPIDDDFKPGELEILQSGLYNLGFLALRASEESRALLSWWQRRLLRGCLMSPAQGMHVDQKWIDLVPLYFEHTAVLRDPGWNVAYWNVAERSLRLDDGVLYAGDSPVRFFHFSGFDVESIEAVSRHQDRFTLRDLPQLRALFVRYRELLLEAGHASLRRVGYAFGRFDDGVAIPASARRLYFELGDTVRKHGDPFASNAPRSFRRWLTEPLPPNGVSRLALALHASRPDLVTHFPDPRHADALAFLAWLRVGGPRDFGIDPSLVPALPEAPVVVPRPPAASRRLGLERRLRPLARALIARFPRLRAPLRRIRDRLRAPALPSATPTVSAPFGVNLSGYAESEKGVGEALRAQLRALDAAGVPVALCNFPDPGSANEEIPGRSFSHEAPYPIHLIHVNADQTPVFARQVGPAWFAGRYSIGAWFWELSRFPSEWLDCAESLDEVWVASRFVQDALSPVLPVPVVRVPLSLDLSPATGRFERASLGLRDDDFVFLFIFDLASYAERKNPLGLIEAFRRAFSPDERVALVIKLAHAQFARDEARRIRATAEAAGVRVIDGVMPRADLRALMAGCDAYVSLHRSEGFGLTLAEAMSFGLPAIATGYSGNLEFMNAKNSLLVDFDLVELEHDVGPYAKGSSWAEPRLDHAAHCMRSLAHDRALAASLGARGRDEIRAQLSPEAVGARVAERLRAIVRTRGSA